MPPLLVTTALAMCAFAGNSLLCRYALDRTAIDPASFTAIRLASGALVLALVVGVRRADGPARGDAWSAAALFAYAACFSFAYESLTAGTGALLLFGAVQATMIGRAVWIGEPLGAVAWGGLAIAIGGLVGLTWPGLAAPPWRGSAAMLLAGVAWGVYSLRGKAAGDPVRVTAGNFVRAVPFALALVLLVPLAHGRLALDAAGVVCAVLSGAVASGLGYCLWYAALPALRAATAASVQLSVPVLTAVAGVLLLHEAPTLRLVLASLAILGGIALVIAAPKKGTRTINS